MEGGGTILIAYILSAMLIGFIAGSLNKGSEDFKRMLISGLVATTIGGIMLIGIFQIAPSNVVTGVDAILYNVLPRMLMGVIIAVVAKVFFWYGMGVHSKTNQ
jgi:biotin transporter BioY